jgi:hypothetical protein
MSVIKSFDSSENKKSTGFVTQTCRRLTTVANPGVPVGLIPAGLEVRNRHIANGHNDVNASFVSESELSGAAILIDLELCGSCFGIGMNPAGLTNRVNT